MSRRRSSNTDLDDENISNDSILSDVICEDEDICRDVVQKCATSAINVAQQKLKDDIERTRASNDILDNFIYFAKWCHMKKDFGEQNSSKQSQIPDRIAADSWSTSIIPIRKIIQTKEKIFEMKPNSKTNSVLSAQSNRSKISKGSRGKIRRSAIDSELKKPLHNIMDEESEVDDLQKVEIIQLKKDEKQPKKDEKKSRKYTKSSAQNKENNANSLSINLNKSNHRNKEKPNRQSMHIGLKTCRLSMTASNVYKYYPNKPFTYDHTGQKMSVVQIKPDKIPNNIVAPLVSFEDDNTQKADTKDKKSKSKKSSQNISASRKTRKKSSIKSKLKRKQPSFKTNSVPVQPPIESIIKVESGVQLKTKNTTIKGTQKKKNTIENLTRSEYNQYIETLRHMTKTQVFDACKTNQNHVERGEDKDENIEAQQRTTSVTNDNNKKHTQSIDSLPSGLKNNAPKSHRSPLSASQRMRQKSPKSIKYKRARMSQQTDRVISEYNKSALLPKINNKNAYSSNEASVDLSTKYEKKTSYRNQKKQNQYQRKFVVKNTTSKIEKSKLGKALFGGK